MRDGTLRRLARGLGAFAILVVLVVGIPIALAVLVGWPLPHGLPTWNEFRSALTTSGPGDEVIVKGLAVVCWLAWAVLATSVFLEVVGVVRGRASRRLRLAGPFQTLAASLVAAVVLMLPSFGPRTAASAAQPLAARLQMAAMSPIVAVAPPVLDEPHQQIRSTSTLMDSANEAAAEETYTVVRRDTLWGIAETRLGDPFRWPELFELNRGRPQSDGRILSDPNLIRPGWSLVLPGAPADVAETPAVRTPSAEAGASTPGTAPVPASTMETPASTTATITTPPSSAASAPTTDARPATQTEPGDGSGIDLPGGSVVGMSLAAGIGASFAAVRLRRRRSRMPGPPRDGIAWEEWLATPAVRRLRRANLAERGPRVAKRAGRDSPSEGHGIEQRSTARAATIALGQRAGEQVELDLLATGTLGLAGRGGYTVARALILDFVSNASEQAAEVIVAGPSFAGRLFPGVDSFSGLEIVADVEAAITRLEVELVHRTRLLDDTDDPDFGRYIEQNPAEPLPGLLLVAEAVHGGLRLRLDAVAAVGGRLGIAALILDPPAGVATVTIGDDGVVLKQSVTGNLEHLAGVSLYRLEPGEASELLAVVAAGRGALECANPPEAPTAQPFDPPEVSIDGPISVHLLGTYRIEVRGEEVRTGLRTKARELLAFLLLHPEGRSVEATVDAIWADSDLARGTEGFRTAVGNLRTVLRKATGDPKALVIERIGERYRVEPSAFDCDIWRLERALKDARSASTLDTASALERAERECRGDLLQGSYYKWAEAAREDVRRRMLDALVRLSEFKAEAGAGEAALAVLHEATTLDPYAEEVYRRLMALQLRLGQDDAAARTYKQLECRLAEIDVDPDEATTDLLPATFRRLITPPGRTLILPPSRCGETK